MSKFPRARNNDPITSLMAADQAKNFTSNHYALILMALKKIGFLGKDGIAKATGLDKSQVARRLNELEQTGKIKLTGKFTISDSGRFEREWKYL